jgi:hypothetical protein
VSELPHLALELGVDRLELFIDGLELLPGGAELFVGTLELLVGTLELLVAGPELLVRGLELLDDGLVTLSHVAELALELIAFHAIAALGNTYLAGAELGPLERDAKQAAQRLGMRQPEDAEVDDRFLSVRLDASARMHDFLAAHCSLSDGGG